MGNGLNTPMWKEPWLSTSKPFTRTGPATEETHHLTVSHLFHPETCEWNREIIQDILPEYAKDILTLRPSKRGGLDRWAWLPTESGVYSTKSSYYEAMNAEEVENSGSIPPDDYNWKSKLWGLKASPKVKILLWKAMQNALPVGENLKHRHIFNNVVCSHCSQEESIVHLFFTCPLAQQVWQSFPCQSTLSSDQFANFREGFEAFKLLLCLPPIGLGEGLLSPWIFWAIWTARNQRVFHDRHMQPVEIISQAIIKAKEWTLAQIVKPQITLIPNPVTQIRNEASIRCNSDAAWKPDQRAGFGWIFTDHQGAELSRGSGTADHISSPLVAEAMAVLLAIQHAQNLGFTNLSIATDSSQLVKALTSEIQPKDLHGIHYDILSLSLLFDVISFRFTPRSSNLLADSVAKEALSSFVSGLAQH